MSSLDLFHDHVKMMKAIVSDAVEMKRMSEVHFQNKRHTSSFNRGKRFNLATRKGFNKWVLSDIKLEFPAMYTVEDRLDNLVNKFTVPHESGESMLEVLIFDKVEGIMDYIKRSLDLEGDTYSTVGCWYTEPAKVKETANRLFVIQKSVLNV